MAFIKKHFYGLVAAGLGVLQFILLAMPFANATVTSFWGGTQTVTANGYETLSGGTAYSVFLVISMIVGILLMLIGAYALVRSLAVPSLPDGFGKFHVNKICKFALWGFGGIVLLTLTIGLIEALDASASAYGIQARAGIGAGCWLYALLAASGAAAPIVLEKVGFFADPAEAPAPEAAPVAPEAIPYAAPYAAPVVPEAVPDAPIAPAVPDAPVAPAAPAAPKFCTNCGYALTAPSAFCPNCGARLG